MKSLIPDLDFISVGSQAAIEKYARRVADAIEQTHRHIAAIQAGEPELQDLAGFDVKVVVLTFGRIQTVNTIFFRPEIDKLLSKRGMSGVSYVVLSLQEFEHLLSLGERGISLAELLARLETGDLGSALEPYRDMLREYALPFLVKQKGEEIIHALSRTA